jgi:hypothetical protein
VSWWEAFSCGACGERYELDDSGPLPTEYRRLEMKVGGVWGLFLSDFEALTLAGLRKVAGLTLEEVRRLKDDRLNPVIIGTQTEVRCIIARLASVEVSATCQRSSSDKAIDAAVLSARLNRRDARF